ncbi:MTH1187 family thiamine-binding protein [Desulfotomaculum defluvii]
MAIVEVTVIPLGTGNTSLSSFVAGCLGILEKSKGIQFQLTPMGTIIEGELEQVMNLVQQMHEQPFAAGADRVNTIIRIDDRRDKKSTMEGKVASVEEKLIKPGGTD